MHGREPLSSGRGRVAQTPRTAPEVSGCQNWVQVAAIWTATTSRHATSPLTPLRPSGSLPTPPPTLLGCAASTLTSVRRYTSDVPRSLRLPSPSDAPPTPPSLLPSPSFPTHPTPLHPTPRHPTTISRRAASPPGAPPTCRTLSLHTGTKLTLNEDTRMAPLEAPVADDLERHIQTNRSRLVSYETVSTESCGDVPQRSKFQATDRVVCRSPCDIRQTTVEFEK